MKVELPDNVNTEFQRLGKLKSGTVFREPRDGSASQHTTLWVACKAGSTDVPAGKVLCMSMQSANPTYKSKDMRVVIVEGTFKVDDWGKG